MTWEQLGIKEVKPIITDRDREVKLPKLTIKGRHDLSEVDTTTYKKKNKKILRDDLPLNLNDGKFYKT